MATNRTRSLYRDRNRFGVKTIDETIISSGWVDDTGVSGYWYYDISSTSILETTQIDLKFDIADIQYTSDIIKTYEAFDGYGRIYATQKPTEDIGCELIVYYGANGEGVMLNEVKVTSGTKKLDSPSETWNAVSVTTPQMSTIQIAPENITAGSIDIEVDGVVLDTVSSSSEYSSFFGFEISINIITSSDFTGSAYVYIEYGSGRNQEVRKFTSVEETLEITATQDRFADITVDGRSGGGLLEVHTEGSEADYEIANELLEKIKAGYSSSLTLKSKDNPRLSGSTYDNVSLGVVGQDTAPSSLVFNADYTKFYMMGFSSDAIHQYTMGDTLDTSTYDNVSFYVGGQEPNPQSLVFNADYTKFYMIGYTNATIHQYTMGETLDTSTYDGISFDVSGQEKYPRSLAFNADYTKFYVMGLATKTIHQYTMGETLDTSNYDEISFDISEQDTYSYSLTFNADYSKFYMMGRESAAIHQYTMGETLDTSNYDEISFDISEQETMPHSLTFNADYTNFYVLGIAKDTIYQYTFGESFNGKVFVSVEY